MAAWGPLTRTPFFFLGPRPYREAEMVAYILREHARGRAFQEIVDDAYIGRCGGQTVLRAALRHPELIRALRRDVAEAIRREQRAVRERMRPPATASARDVGEPGRRAP